MKIQTIAFTISMVVFAATNAAAQSYAITQSVIASGGGQNSTGTAAGGNVYKLDGTIGQTIAGQPASGAPYSVYAGFFAPANLAPTAAAVTVGGRVLTENGGGIRSVNVTLTGADGTSRTVRTGAGGRFRFTDVPAGATYFISVSAKRYRFVQNTQILTATEDVFDMTFVAVGLPDTPTTENLENPSN